MTEEPVAVHATSIPEALDRIAERVATLVRTVQALRDENHLLRITADRHEGENRLLRERLDTARGRVETLIAQMPADLG
jgi:uncharacterized protein (TIGR02449 family)